MQDRARTGIALPDSFPNNDELHVRVKEECFDLLRKVQADLLLRLRSSYPPWIRGERRLGPSAFHIRSFRKRKYLNDDPRSDLAPVPETCNRRFLKPCRVVCLF